jgi:hypothetical protein
MDSFEKQLARLPLARPSAGLRQRIFGNMNESAARPSWYAVVFRHGVPIAWAASIAIVAGLAGALLTHSLRNGASTVTMMPVEASVTVQLESEKNIFDFTRPGAESMYDDIEVAVSVDEEA